MKSIIDAWIGKAMVLILAILGVFCDSSAGQIAFTAIGYSGNEAVENFPALVRLSEGLAGFSYEQCTDKQLQFTDAAGTVLSHDVELWNPEGESLVWVKIPILTKETRIILNYGETVAVENEDALRASVWSGASVVLHLGDATEKKQLRKNSAQEDTSVLTCKTQNDQVFPIPVAGVAGMGDELTALQIQQAVESEELKELGSVFTFSGWFKTSALTGDYAILFSSQHSTSNDWTISLNTKDDGRTLRIKGGESGTQYVTFFPEGSPITNGAWHYVTVVFSNETVWCSHNAGASHTVKVGTPAMNGEGTDELPRYTIGANRKWGNNFSGQADEIRLIPGVLSPARIYADYETVTKRDFFFAAPLKDNAKPAGCIVLKVNGYTGGDVMNFRALVRLTEGLGGFSYTDCPEHVQLQFTDLNGVVLPHEVEQWNTQGESLIWVKLPTLTSQTKIHLSYGGDIVCGDEAAARESVWADEVLVYHLEDATEANGLRANVACSDKKLLAGMTVGNLAPSRVVGIVGYADDVSAGRIEPATTNDLARLDALGETFTFSAWIKFDNTKTANYDHIFARQMADNKVDWALSLGGDARTFRVKGGDTSPSYIPDFFPEDEVLTNDGWHLITVCYSGNSVTSYHNDGSPRTVTTGGVAANGVGQDERPTFTLGAQRNGSNVFRGAVDELRLRPGVVTADHVRANYATVARSDFFRAYPFSVGCVIIIR